MSDSTLEIIGKRAARLAFRLARSRWMAPVVRWGFKHMSFAIPVERLVETPTLVAFRHPQPSYPLHILLVPKRPISGPEALGRDDADLLVDVFEVVRQLVERFQLHQAGFRLITNGGAYQEIPLLHFHLVAGQPAPLENSETHLE